jgi:hypothetical protein
LSSKASSPAAREQMFGGYFHTASPLVGHSPLNDFPPPNQIPAFKSEIPAVLPQSFLERSVSANTRYELTLIISHGRFSSSSK